MNEQSGFTIIEIIVAVAIFTVLSMGVVALVSGVFTGSNQQATLLADTDQARQLSFRLTGELRNMGTADTGAYALNKADAQEIIFFSNIDSDAAMERVRYYVQGGKLYRGIINPSGSPLAYVTANEVATIIQSNVGNASTPLFYYYNDNYDGTTTNSTPLTQPVNVTSVRFIKLNLMIFNKAGVKNTNTYTVTAGAAVRNLKTNLGD